MLNVKVYDMNGKAHKLSEFFGYPIVVNCWASWCTPCKKELPYFDYAYSQYKDKGVIFLMVDMVDGSPTEAGKAKQIVSDNGYSFPVYFDNDNSLKSAYGVTSIPRTLLIKANGELSTILRGTQTEASVMNAIKNLIG